MASNYNSRGLPVEILVEGNQHRIIRPRQTMDDILASEMAAL
jgi:diaminopimelate decarboxylase